MKSFLKELSKYLFQVIKKWYFILLLVLDAAGLIITYLIPQLKIPQLVYGIVLITGFFFAGFNVYRENQASLNSRILGFEKKLKETGINFSTEPPNPLVELEYLEGSEYRFVLEVGGVNKFSDKNPSLPTIIMRLNLCLSNIGNVDLKVLGIDTDLGFTVNGLGVFPLVARTVTYLSTEDKNMIFPFMLKVKEAIIIHIESDVHCGPTDSELIYAAYLRKEIAEKKFLKSVEISVDTLIPESGDLSKQRKSFTFSIKPLYDLLFTHWADIERSDLLEIARGK